MSKASWLFPLNLSNFGFVTSIAMSLFVAALFVVLLIFISFFFVALTGYKLHHLCQFNSLSGSLCITYTMNPVLPSTVVLFLYGQSSGRLNGDEASLHLKTVCFILLYFSAFLVVHSLERLPQH
jgi:hypothetical protein